MKPVFRHVECLSVKREGKDDSSMSLSGAVCGVQVITVFRGFHGVDVLCQW